MRLCIVYHDVCASSLKVIQFPIKGFVMGITNCLTCGSGSGDADALSALLLLTALNSLTGVCWSRRCRKSLGNTGIVCLFVFSPDFSQLQFKCHYSVICCYSDMISYLCYTLLLWHNRALFFHQKHKQPSANHQIQ